MLQYFHAEQDIEGRVGEREEPAVRYDGVAPYARGAGELAYGAQRDVHTDELCSELSKGRPQQSETAANLQNPAPRDLELREAMLDGGAVPDFREA
jgi:hypothetical protein